MIATERRFKSVQTRARLTSMVPAYQAEWFAGHDRIVAPIRRYMTVFPDQCHYLIDIGAGDGAVLDDIASRLPQLKRLVGISADPSGLNKAQVRSHHDARLSFHQVNPWAWLRRERREFATIFSYDNLSMVPESALKSWFSELYFNGSEGLALVEPQSGGCAELPTLLSSSSWTVRHAESAYQAGQLWWHVFASREPNPKKQGATP